MASIANDPNGRKRILFFNQHGDRKVVRLGKVTRRQAETVKARIEALVGALIHGTAPDEDTARWLADRGDDLRDKLASAGLIDPPKRATLARLLLATSTSEICWSLAASSTPTQFELNG